jgi:hypothetical protein
MCPASDSSRENGPTPAVVNKQFDNKSSDVQWVLIISFAGHACAVRGSFSRHFAHTRLDFLLTTVITAKRLVEIKLKI